MSGAWVNRARLAAALGNPIPTKQAAPLRSILAAATVIISSGVYPFSRMARHSLDASPEAFEVRCPQQVTLDPNLKSLALARDLVPMLIEGVIARVIALRIGRKRATFDFTNRAHYPGRQYHGVGRSIQPI